MAHVCYFLVAFYLFVFQVSNIAEAGPIGVNYGVLGNNLPPPPDVIALIKSRGITKVRIFEPFPDILDALSGSGIEVIVGSLNSDIQPLANDLSFARTWVLNHVVPFATNLQFRCISVGNEVIPGVLGGFVYQAMLNLRQALDEVNLYKIPVSTATSMAILANSYPPSATTFTNDVMNIMKPIVGFLQRTKSPILLNAYPYFTYNSFPDQVPLPYALFTSDKVQIQDGNLAYKNLFDAMLDATYWALEKAGAGDVEIVVAESGWPSGENGNIATIENALAYNSGLVKHVSSSEGTPKRPGKNIETYIFSMFNENQKPAGTEQHYGLYNPDKTEVYHINFPV
ncbi:hypothetical protein ACFE04_031582 [Oxalis oulophora]